MRRLMLLAAVLGGLVLAGPVQARVASDPDVTWTVQAEDQPEKKPWTDPAKLAFKSVQHGKDLWDIAIAAKAEVPWGLDHKLFASGAVIRRTETGKEQEFYALKTGANLEFEPIKDDNNGNKELLVFVDPAIGYARTTVFKDAKATCTTAPLPVGCFKQHEESLRVDMKVQPAMNWMTNQPYRDEEGKWDTGDKSYFSSVGLIVMPFYDRIINAKLDAKGLKQEGSVSGVQTQAALAVTPRWNDYRWILRASAKQMTATSRSGPRRAAFPANAVLYEASVTYEFGVRSFESDKGWNPSVGLAYASGEDPLTGRPKGTDWTLALKFSYKK